MKDIFKKHHLLLLVIAVLLSIGIVRTTERHPVSPCAMEPGCIVTSQIGTSHTATRGFPLTLHQTNMFKPEKPIHYAETKVETEGFSVPFLIMDVVFWFALLDLAWRIITFLKSNSNKTHKK
jgi:hypothetical protein